MKAEKILVIGANGQIGSELVEALVHRHGAARVVAADLHTGFCGSEVAFAKLDVLDSKALRALVVAEGVTQVYHLAAILSATGEKVPLQAWNLNMNGLLNLLELARELLAEGRLLRVFWPSSIAAFGPNSPRLNTPQYCVMDPTSMYGISKLAGERLCEYYHQKYGVDVRSLRYPGILSSKTPPGGGTTDYAIAIFLSAKKREVFECFLSQDTTLPMIAMEDALRATLSLMEASPEQIKIRSSYNVTGLSFSPAELALAIRQRLPAFQIRYVPDERQAIADSWPQSLDDSRARADWGWKALIGMDQLVDGMLA